MGVPEKAFTFKWVQAELPSSCRYGNGVSILYSFVSLASHSGPKVFFSHYHMLGAISSCNNPPNSDAQVWSEHPAPAASPGTNGGYTGLSCWESGRRFQRFLLPWLAIKAKSPFPLSTTVYFTMAFCDIIMFNL